MVSEINEVLQALTTAIVALVSLFMIAYAKRNQNAWAGVGFALSILCYLITYTAFFKKYEVTHFIFATGAISIPVFFWLLARALFDDHFKPTWITFAWFAVQLTPRYIQIYFTNPGDVSHSYLHLISEIVSIGFILAGLYIALRTKQADLIDKRRRFRNVFIVVSAIVIGLTLIVEIATFGQEPPRVLQMFQRSAILILAVYFLFKNFELKAGFFFNDLPKKKTVVVQEDSALQSKLLLLLQEQKIYRKEGLTIRELADVMNEQEYKLRRMINGQLGFKNFNDFLNQHRITEACQILSDPAQNRKTILEIAYELGYQSIGPFNKAFKELTGSTPTIFRKSQQSA